VIANNDEGDSTASNPLYIWVGSIPDAPSITEIKVRQQSVQINWSTPPPTLFPPSLYSLYIETSTGWFTHADHSSTIPFTIPVQFLQ